MLHEETLPPPKKKRKEKEKRKKKMRNLVVPTRYFWACLREYFQRGLTEQGRATLEVVCTYYKLETGNYRKKKEN